MAFILPNAVRDIAAIAMIATVVFVFIRPIGTSLFVKGVLMTAFPGWILSEKIWSRQYCLEDLI